MFDPIEDFWDWWAASGRTAAEAGVDSGRFDGFVTDMGSRVAAIGAELSWELAPGTHSRHALVVTAAGVPEHRRMAERWHRRAPDADATWEYQPARPAAPGQLTCRLRIADQNLDLRDLRFGMAEDEKLAVIHAEVFHPDFLTMPPDAPGHVAFLALDRALGEDGVTRWIGGVKTVTHCPKGAVTAADLIEAVRALASRQSTERRWAVAVGRRNGNPLIARVAQPAKWIDHPLLDLYLGVTLPFADQNPAGLPNPEALDRLRAVEAELTGTYEDRVRLCAHETSQGSRTLHLYADSDDPDIAEELRDEVADWPGAQVIVRRDPGWRAIRHLTRT